MFKCWKQIEGLQKEKYGIINQKQNICAEFLEIE